MAWECYKCADRTGDKLPSHHRLCPRRGADDEDVAVIDREHLHQIQRLPTALDSGQWPDRD